MTGRVRGLGVAAIGAPLAVLAWPAPAFAHGEAPAGPLDVWNHWGTDPGALLLVLGGAVIYALGLRRLWRRAGRGAGVRPRTAGAFAAGIVALAVALLSPLDPLGEVLFSAHMAQHLLLILVAAPLLVLGRPERAALWAVPRRWRSGFGRLTRFCERLAGPAAAAPGLPALVVVLATGVLWLWHLPALYDLALRSDSMHAVEHASFLVTALLFWTGILRVRPRDRRHNGLRVLYVFAMAVQGSILGALITFASRPLYASHAGLGATWGIGALEDQQLAGLLMWVPPALLYIAVAAYLMVTWLEGLSASRAPAAPQGRAHLPPA